jgi:hypothetical protein
LVYLIILSTAKVKVLGFVHTISIIGVPVFPNVVENSNALKVVIIVLYGAIELVMFCESVFMKIVLVEGRT